MHAPRLSTTDLNLLVVFDALVAEGHVTRAAERVGLTQPAMSHALGRLRKLVGDPLFVRTPQGMVPTPRALELVEPVRRALGEIDRALHQTPRFEPREARRPFVLACVDFGSFVLVPPLLARLRTDAPAVDLVVRQLRMETIEKQLADGEVDLAVGVLYDADDPWMVSRRLFHERFVCIARTGHPKVHGALSLDEFVALDHALISPRGRRGGFVDTALHGLGKKRRVALMIPHFLAAPLVVAQSDLLLTLPERIARGFAAMLPLTMVAPPIELSDFTVSAFWHERQTHDPAHAWFRGLVQDVCQTV
ncbi:Transcriptional regulator, LysR family protein [Minicystis rosea]|nr:Transcriptional regulator, LysR family protein [Minicystis rosea]